MISRTDFADVSSPDFPGEFFKCVKCAEIVADVERDQHKCSLTTDAVFDAEEADLEESAQAVAVAAPGEVKSAIHSFKSVCKIVWDNRLSRTERAFTQDILHKIAYKEMQILLGNVRIMRDGEYARNDELRARGIPYAERAKQLNRRKIEWCDKEEAQIMRMMQSFSVRPIREWFDESDYYAAKISGMGKVVRFKLDQIIK